MTFSVYPVTLDLWTFVDKDARGAVVANHTAQLSQQGCIPVEVESICPAAQDLSAPLYISTGGQTMSKVIAAVYTNGVFRPLEPVVLPEGESVQVYVPESPPPHKSAWQHWKPLKRCMRN